MKQFYFIFLFIIFLSCKLFSQGKGDTWCFGDSVTLALQSGNFVNQSSSNINSIEASASISDSIGNLLFYCGGYTNNTVGYINVWNASHQLIQNGDSILGDGTITNGLIIIPFPSDSAKYYIFSIGSVRFLYYSVVDMSLNSGNGAVTQKNVLLYNASTLSEKLTGIKHGNGRDWWIITHQWQYNTASTDTFLLFLTTPNGISAPFKQAIGTFYNQNYPFNGLSGEIQPSNDGTKLLCVGTDMIDLFDFDRCTGIFSNYQNITPASPLPPLNGYYGCSFSSDNSKVYVSNWHNGLTSNLSYQLFQLNLLTSNIPSSKSIIFSTTNPSTPLGQHQIANNNKIYIASSYGTSFPNNNYTTQNMNLSVINFPDSDAVSCGFSQYSISLGGRKSILGLPNMPNYNLGADEGSPCDTLTSITEIENNFHFNIFPNPNNGNFSVSYSLPENKSGRIEIFDVTDKIIYSQPLPQSTITQNFSLPKLANGIYYCILKTDSQTICKKIIIIPR